MAAGTVYLMYHELELPGRALNQHEEGYVRYVVTETDFRAQLAHLRAGGFLGLNVTEALEHSDQEPPGVAITCDDGSETDRLAAAPLLKEAGFNATFYVVAGFIGRRGYLSPAHLRELSDLGFEIGCHSMTHPYLSHLGPDPLRTEIVEPKARLEQLIGRSVDHFSCPGGRWSRRAAEVAREAGYRSVAASRPGANSRATDRFRLARVPVMRGTTIAEFDRLCRSQGLLARRARAAVLAAARGVIGHSTYERVRAAILGTNGG